ncbi:hypothetical protein [Ectobacillus funiculus]|uniref:Lipoprotein n=1 Tax=Ectobacillus funiculus TaxID=137993 RepID=A0ABV5WJ12_9BACI
MRKTLILLSILLILVSCQKIRGNDIKNYGIPDKQEELIKLGITAVSYDKKGNLHFHVDKINPDTRRKIEQRLSEIFGQKVDFTLHDDLGNVDPKPK